MPSLFPTPGLNVLQSAQNYLRGNLVPQENMLALGNKMPSQWHQRRVQRKSFYLSLERDQQMPGDAPVRLLTFAQPNQNWNITITNRSLLLRSELATVVRIYDWGYTTLEGDTILGLCHVPQGVSANFGNVFHAFNLNQSNLLLHGHLHLPSAQDGISCHSQQNSVQQWDMDTAPVLDKNSLLGAAFGWRAGSMTTNGLCGILATVYLFEL